MPRTRPPYPAEFKMEAVRLLRAKARTPRQLAVELGCSEQTLRNWLRQDELDRGVREDGLTTEERAELVRLRRENRVLQQEKEILRKAAVFFASVPEWGRAQRVSSFFRCPASVLVVVCSLSCCPLGAAACGRA
jgi:transposase